MPLPTAWHHFAVGILVASLLGLLGAAIQISSRTAVVEALHVTVEQRLQRMEFKLDRLLEGGRR